MSLAGKSSIKAGSYGQRKKQGSVRSERIASLSAQEDLAKGKGTSKNTVNGSTKNKSFKAKAKKWKRKRFEESSEAGSTGGKRKS